MECVLDTEECQFCMYVGYGPCLSVSREGFMLVCRLPSQLVGFRSCAEALSWRWSEGFTCGFVAIAFYGEKCEKSFSGPVPRRNLPMYVLRCMVWFQVLCSSQP